MCIRDRIYTGLISGFDSWLTACFSALQEFFRQDITIAKFRAFEDAVACLLYTS